MCRIRITIGDPCKSYENDPTLGKWGSSFGRGLYRDSMSSSHGLCRLKLAPTNEYNILSVLKGVLLRVGGGMGRHISIAQVDIWSESWCVLM